MRGVRLNKRDLIEPGLELQDVENGGSLVIDISGDEF